MRRLRVSHTAYIWMNPLACPLHEPYSETSIVRADAQTSFSLSKYFGKASALACENLARRQILKAEIKAEVESDL